MQQLTVKLYRSIPGSIESYGKDFNQQLDNFVGGSEQWDNNNSHGIATVPHTTIRVQRYEFGPELLVTIIELLPPILAAIAELVKLWQEARNSQQETRSVTITIGNSSYSGPIQRQSDIGLIIDLLRSVQ